MYTCDPLIYLLYYSIIYLRSLSYICISLLFRMNMSLILVSFHVLFLFICCRIRDTTDNLQNKIGISEFIYSLRLNQINITVRSNPLFVRVFSQGQEIQT